MIPASPSLSQIAVGQPQTPVPIASELAYIESNALNAGSASGDTMAGPLTVPALKVGDTQFSIERLMYYGTDTGVVNALAVTASGYPAPFAGMVIAVKAANTNTATATLSINGGSPYTIYQNDQALVGGEIVANNWLLLGFDGSFWNVIGMAPGGYPATSSKVALMAPSGTRMLFQQATPPPGWTQDTTVQNDSLLRMVNTASANTYTGVGVSTIFRGGTANLVDGTAISVAQMPSHNHGVYDPGHFHLEFNVAAASGNNVEQYGNSSGTPNGYPSNAPTSSSGTGIGIDATGGSAAHQHSLSALNVNSIDVIVGVKN